MKPYEIKQYAGNAFIGLGLLDAFTAFGLLITRKNHGETEFQWLGTDDYLVMSALLLGGICTAWCGRSLNSAGLIQSTQALTGFNPEQHRYMTTANKAAFAAGIVFFMMCSYAFLGGFHSTPTPESSIGPHLDNNTELSVFSVTFGMTALLSLLAIVVAAAQLGKLDHLKNEEDKKKPNPPDASPDGLTKNNDTAATNDSPNKVNETGAQTFTQNDFKKNQKNQQKK